MSMPPAELRQRSTPRQARSRQTLEHVLDCAAALLDEVGAERFNTNLLAERARLGVRAIYRYFPNKLAILVALAERARELERAWIGDLTQAPRSWREAVAGSIDGYYAAASRHRGLVALRAAMQAMPELRAIDEAASLDLQRDLETGLRAAGVRLEEARLRALSQTVIECSNRMLDIALASPPAHAALLLDELKGLIVKLLADYLD